MTDLANDGFTAKWMLFSFPEEVREVWAAVVDATKAGRLGWAAKVATEYKPGKGVLICVYTEDHRDVSDVGRVLGELRSMVFGQRLSYKEDAATSGLRYGSESSPKVSQP